MRQVSFAFGDVLDLRDLRNRLLGLYGPQRDVYTPIGQWTDVSFRDRSIDVSAHGVGRLSANVEVLLGPHHSLVLSPNVLAFEGVVSIVKLKTALVKSSQLACGEGFRRLARKSSEPAAGADDRVYAAGPATSSEGAPAAA